MGNPGGQKKSEGLGYDSKTYRDESPTFVRGSSAQPSVPGVLAEGRGNASQSQESAQGRETTPVTNDIIECGDGTCNYSKDCIKDITIQF